MDKTIFIYVLIRFWKSFENFDRCVDSVFSQNYTNYKILFVDDGSINSKEQVDYIKKKLKGHICVFNKVRKYSLRNAYEIIHKFAKKDAAIIFNLDGDDWLLPNALETVASIYRTAPKCALTYGECLIWDGKDISSHPSRHIFPLTNTRYKSATEKNNTFRLETFRPLHPRTWKVSLFKSILKDEFLDASKRWIRFPEDQAMFFPMLEKINGNYKVIKKPIYVYNISNTHSIIKENTLATLKEEIEIRKKHSILKDCNIKNEIINIYYNKILSIPLISSFAYLIQIILFKNNLTSNIFVSNKNNHLRNTLLNQLSNPLTIMVKSSNMQNILKKINANKVFDCPAIKLDDQSINSLYQIMWTLIYCDSVTKKTKLLLNKLLPVNYPVKS